MIAAKISLQNKQLVDQESGSPRIPKRRIDPILQEVYDIKARLNAEAGYSVEKTLSVPAKIQRWTRQKNRRIRIVCSTCKFLGKKQGSQGGLKSEVQHRWKSIQ